MATVHEACAKKPSRSRPSSGSLYFVTDFPIFTPDLFISELSVDKYQFEMFIKFA